MGCGCNKGKSPGTSLSWTVNLAGTGKTFDDGSLIKTYSLAGEANLAIAKLGLSGRVRPTPAT